MSLDAAAWQILEALAAQQRELLAQQREILARLDRIDPPGKSRRTPTAHDARLVAALADAIGADTPFTSAEIIEQFRTELADVMRDAMVDPSSPSELGHALGRMNGQRVGEFRVEQLKRAGRGVRWQVCRSVDRSYTP